MVKKTALTALVVASITASGVAGAQAATATAASAGPAINDLAPDFSLTGADRYGVLKTPVKLSDYRGRTVVLAFFFQARTKG
ncbi:MAG: peroxiredoxin family protein [Gemmatimonadaceae bacterium]